jgi:hypothetical protein
VSRSRSRSRSSSRGRSSERRPEIKNEDMVIDVAPVADNKEEEDSRSNSRHSSVGDRD